MSCSSKAHQTLAAVQARLGAPPGTYHANSARCPVCGRYSGFHGCANPDCGAIADALESIRNWPVPNAFAALFTLTREAAKWIESLGIPEYLCAHALQTAGSPESPRCPVCRQPLGGHLDGRCYNPECSRGATEALVDPMHDVDGVPLEHLQNALIAYCGRDALSDSWDAWRLRGDNLMQTLTSQSMQATLAMVQSHVDVGFQHGWLDPDSAAYDPDEAEFLYQCVNVYLRGVHYRALHAIAGETGDWKVAGLSNVGQRRDYHNPATPPARRAKLQARAQAKFDAAMAEDGPEQIRVATNMAKIIIATTTIGRLVAEPPFDFSNAALQVFTDVLAKPLSIRVSGFPNLDFFDGALYVYTPVQYRAIWRVYLCYRRLAGNPSLLRPDSVASSLVKVAEKVGYGSAMTNEEAKLVLANSWNAAQLRQYREAQG